MTTSIIIPAMAIFEVLSQIMVVAAGDRLWQWSRCFLLWRAYSRAYSSDKWWPLISVTSNYCIIFG